jgi:dTDP-4-dehydrorhamnose reductase
LVLSADLKSKRREKKMFALTGGRGCVAKYMKALGVVDLQCDVTVPDEIELAIETARPSVILHLASKSDVDWCEDKKNEDKVINVNLRGTFNVCTVAEKFQANVVLLSSDHVFSGDRWWGKYKESDRINPCNFYGNSKASAEALTAAFHNLKVVRTSYLFDFARLESKINEAIAGRVEYPDFLNRSFLHYQHFAENMFQYMVGFVEMPTILHLSGSESLSWYDFMKAIALQFGCYPNVAPRRNEVDGQAARGHNLGLDVSRSVLLGFRQHSYREGIAEMVRSQ